MTSKKQRHKFTIHKSFKSNRLSCLLIRLLVSILFLLKFNLVYGSPAPEDKSTLMLELQNDISKRKAHENLIMNPSAEDQEGLFKFYFVLFMDNVSSENENTARHYLAEFYEAINCDRNAMEHWKAILRSDPHDAAAQLSLFDLYLSQKKFSGALEVFCAGAEGCALDKAGMNEYFIRLQRLFETFLKRKDKSDNDSEKKKMENILTGLWLYSRWNNREEAELLLRKSRTVFERAAYKRLKTKYRDIEKHKNFQLSSKGSAERLRLEDLTDVKSLDFSRCRRSETLDDEINIFERIRQWTPKEIPVLNNLAVLYFKNGECRKSLDSLIEIVNLSPFYKIGWDNLILEITALQTNNDLKDFYRWKKMELQLMEKKAESDFTLSSAVQFEKEYLESSAPELQKTRKQKPDNYLESSNALEWFTGRPAYAKKGSSLKKSPSPSAATVYLVRTDERVEVLDIHRNWCNVEFNKGNGRTGWLHFDDLLISAVVKYDNVIVEFPRLTSKKAGRLKEGHHVRLLERVDEWIRISVLETGEKGWVKITGLK